MRFTPVELDAFPLRKDVCRFLRCRLSLLRPRLAINTAKASGARTTGLAPAPATPVAEGNLFRDKLETFPRGLRVVLWLEGSAGPSVLP